MRLTKKEIPNYTLGCLLCSNYAKYRISIVDDKQYEQIVVHICPKCESELKRIIKDSEVEK